jgi:cbb3-type cytochrome oxidase maturation protein
MEILFLLIPVSLVLLALAIGAFFWAVRSGQFDDLDSPAYRILMDDDERTREGTDRERSSSQDGGPSAADDPPQSRSSQSRSAR